MTYDLTRLSDPFPPDRVSWRVGSTTERDGKLRGMALAYVDARDIMDRLDEVVGPANWQDKYRRDHETTICSLSIRIGNEWVTKEDGSGDTDVEAEKGALSKALVRAAVKWKIGRYLYDLDSPWVECEKRGKSAFITSNEKANLKRLLERSYRPAPRAKVEPPKSDTPFDDADNAEITSSQLMAEAMIEALGKRAGDDAVSQFLSKPAIARDLSVMDREDFDRVHEFANQRRQQAAVRAA